jgi:hypothetical protein
MENLINAEGITIKELKNWLKDLPEIDEDTGEEFEGTAKERFTSSSEMNDLLRLAGL